MGPAQTGTPLAPIGAQNSSTAPTYWHSTGPSGMVTEGAAQGSDSSAWSLPAVETAVQDSQRSAG